MTEGEIWIAPSLWTDAILESLAESHCTGVSTDLILMGTSSLKSVIVLSAEEVTRDIPVGKLNQKGKGYPWDRSVRPIWGNGECDSFGTPWIADLTYGGSLRAGTLNTTLLVGLSICLWPSVTGSIPGSSTWSLGLTVMSDGPPVLKAYLQFWLISCWLLLASLRRLTVSRSQVVFTSLNRYCNAES